MEDFLTAFLTGFVGLTSLESWDLIRAALFLWMMFFLEAKSAILTASLIVFSEGFFSAFLIRVFKSSFNFLFSSVLFLSCLNFFLADFVTGTFLF